MSKMVQLDWSGQKILLFPVTRNRRVLALSETDRRDIPTDVRQWITPSDCWEIREAAETHIQNNKVVVAGRDSTDPLNYDLRARLCWDYLADHFNYKPDGSKDLWQFPSETLALKHGDCEDLAILLASLLMVSGISSYCVRVVIGDLSIGTSSKGSHAWVVYKNEQGDWCILDATLKPEELPEAGTWHIANEWALTGKDRTYRPKWCFNQHHAWSIDSKIIEWSPELYTPVVQP